MFKLQRLEISGFKSFADYTEIVFTGSGITAVVGPNGCGKSNVSDAMSWVLGEQRVKTLRGGDMKDVIFQGTKSRKPGGMAEVVLHLVRDDTAFDIDENELEDIDEALSGIDDHAVDIDEIEQVEPADLISDLAIGQNGFHEEELETETVLAAQVGSIQTVERKVKTRRHWRPRSLALEFAPGEAVSVTRRLYLSGESEYQLNGKACRLRDINDLFAGTGLSGAHYAIIEQGRIGQILSAKPTDRRNLIEEAAGISKFRTRQRAAETRLDSAKSNLGRISDIVSEIDKQANSLRRQAGKTRRFKILQEEFRVLLRQLFAADGTYLSALSADLEVRLTEAAAIEADLQTKVAAKEEAFREATHNARRAEESLAELRRIHAENALERDRAERDHVYKSEQIVNLNNRTGALRTEIDSTGGRLAVLGGELERLKKEEQTEEAEFSTAEAALREAEAEHQTRVDELDHVEDTLEDVRSQLMQHTAAVERYAEVGRQLENNFEKLTRRAEGLRNEGLRAAENHSAHEKHAEELARTLLADEAKLEALQAEKQEIFTVTTNARECLRTAEGALQELQDEFSAKKHRLATLLELEEKRAVYAPQVQRLFAEQDSIGVRLSGVLADKLNVDERAEVAVETLFGSYLQAVLVDSLKDAKRISAWLKANDIGRTAMLILPAGGAVDARRGRSPADGPAIEDFLGVSDEFARVLRDVFPREMSARLVENFESRTARGDVLVNFDGDMLLGGRLLVGGKQRSDGKNESLLAFKRELNGLEKASEKLALEVATARTAMDKARQLLIESEEKTVDLQSVVIKVDRGIHGLQIQARSAKEEIERAARHLKVVADEVSQTESEIADLRSKLEEAKASAETAEIARVEDTTNLELISQDLAALRIHVDGASATLNEKRTLAATSGERRRSVQSALRRVENEGKELETRLALQNLEISESEVRIKSLHSAIYEITDKIASASADIELENIKLAESIAKLAAEREASDAMSDELAELNRRSAEARNDRAAIEIHQAEAVTQLKNVGDNCIQELNLTLTDLVSEIVADEDFVLETAHRESDDLRQRLDNFGAINMLALEELAETEERLLFLTSQRQDIIDSIAATEEALREIKQRSREKFRSAFDAININFVEFFQELFGGGRGEMTLLESDDILEAGIEVVAQPPGKRLQNILLLSGGEKAMAAIALVLAIFKYRPSPFCLLDEVDAPLDDANVGRFAGKIAEMSEKTQFIVITHNKRTMEAARALYGVTMQEAGVSKVVSVKFE